MEDVTKATQSMNIDENKKGKVAIATESTDLTVNEETKLEKKMMKFCSLQQTRDFDWSIVSAKTFKRNPKTYFVIRGTCVCVCVCEYCVGLCVCVCVHVCVSVCVVCTLFTPVCPNLFASCTGISRQAETQTQSLFGIRRHIGIGDHEE